MFWGHGTSHMKISTEERGAMQSVFLKWDGQRARVPICILRACPLINIGRRTLVVRGNGQMEHLRNGTPEHRTEYHLLLSDLIPFDQNNCHLHRYHQFCHLHWRHRHSPSHQGFFGSKGGDFWIRSNADHHCLRKSLTVKPHSNHHIHCFNATDILFTYWEILTPANLSAGTKIALFSVRVRLLQMSRGLLCFSLWCSFL